MLNWILKMFSGYDEAKAEADATEQPLWDTKALPERYAVGYPSIEVEEDLDNVEWQQLQ
jgi:hypothetical protein